MTSLREELGARPTTATPYTLLCPPGWRRVPPLSLVEDGAADKVFDAMKAEGRPDLLMQFRSLLARYRATVRQSNAIDAYLPPLVDEVPLPAAMIVSPFVLPSGVTWEQALSRLARGGEVERADFTETPMFVWRRGETVSDDAASLASRVSHYMVPAPEQDARRALHFQYTVMAADDAEAATAFETLEVYGDLMMSTMRWINPR